jgi:hypothetical protein
MTWPKFTSGHDTLWVLTTRRMSRLISAVAAALFVSTTPFVARAASVFAIVGSPPMDAISTSGGCPHAAMPHEVANYAADNSTLNAAGCLRITWESNRHDGKTEEARNQQRVFHELLLVQAS